MVNTVAFDKDTIHICTYDNMSMSVAELYPYKMNKYFPPENTCACTFQNSSLIKLFKNNCNSITCLYKPKDVNKLVVAVFKNDTCDLDMTVDLEMEDSINYMDDSNWDSVPNLLIQVKDFCQSSKMIKKFNNIIEGYAKHMTISALNSEGVGEMRKLYSRESKEIVLKNVEVAHEWESMVSKHLKKNRQREAKTAGSSRGSEPHNIQCHGQL